MITYSVNKACVFKDADAYAGLPPWTVRYPLVYGGHDYADFRTHAEAVRWAHDYMKEM